ncbi:hypothetical protein Avbf_02988 [Armadillidium vulgare]|nr:hypothetical protein Avbf_02988 [Armadillidium vulgare]
MNKVRIDIASFRKERESEKLAFNIIEYSIDLHRNKKFGNKSIVRIKRKDGSSRTEWEIF